jgi:hypothetical protein
MLTYRVFLDSASLRMDIVLIALIARAFSLTWLHSVLNDTLCGMMIAAPSQSEAFSVGKKSDLLTD